MRTSNFRVNFEMGGDCSVVRRSKPIDLQGVRKFSVGVGWPAGLTGVLSLEVNNHGRQEASPGLGATITKHPAGTADGVIITGCTTDAGFVMLVCTPTTGGTGINLLDEGQGANTTPNLVFKE
jgi:hypothetical protein